MNVRNALAASALLVSAACGSSNSTPTTPTPTTPTTTQGSGTPVSIPAGARTLGSGGYTPNPLTVAVGTTVTWTNADTVAHTVTSDGGVFDSANMPAGAKFNFTFQAKGTFPYHCTFHPGMVASVVVQ